MSRTPSPRPGTRRDSYKPTQTWKRSKPEKVGTSWRIRRHDGELVGYFATKELAQRVIDTARYLL